MDTPDTGASADSKGAPRTRKRRKRSSTFGTVIGAGPNRDRPPYFVRWREGGRHRKISGFKNRTAALEALARVRSGLSDGTLVEKRKGGIAFSAVASEWLRLHSAPNLRSHDDNQRRYELHLRPFFADTPLNAITATRILELRARLQSKVIDRKHHRDSDGKHVSLEARLAPRTINLIMALLRTILRYAVASGHITVSPTDRLGRGRLMIPVERTKLDPPIPRPEDVGRLLANVRTVGEAQHRPALFPLFATLVYTGIRRGEALGARWEDVDLHRRMLKVKRSYGAMTKSKAWREVPLPAGLVAILREWRLRSPWGNDGLLFPDDTTGTMVSKNATFVQAALWSALKAAGLKRVRVHDLRHQCVAAFLTAGGSIYDASKNLGHASVAFTAQVYGHLSADHRVQESDRIAFEIPTETAAKVIAFGAPADAETVGG